MEIQQRKCECASRGVCHCFQDAIDKQIWQLNVEDIAESIVEILIMCRILRSKARAALEVIINVFNKYGQERTRVDMIPMKKMHKTKLIHELSTTCKMERFDVQLCYSIIRRAFRAFFYATDEYGRPNRQIEAHLKHSRECVWAHAADRTTQVYAIYESLDFAEQKKFGTKLKCIYKKLHDRIEARFIRLESLNERKRFCRLNIRNPNASTERISLTEFLMMKPTEELNKAIPRTVNCSCTKLDCWCDIVEDDESSKLDIRKGPFECRWVPVLDKIEQLTEVDLPPDFVCSSTATEEEFDTDEFCTCEVCECLCEECSELLTASEGVEEQDSQIIDYCAKLKDFIGEPKYPKRTLFQDEPATLKLIKDVPGKIETKEISDEMVDRHENIEDILEAPELIHSSSKDGTFEPEEERLIRKHHKIKSKPDLEKTFAVLEETQVPTIQKEYFPDVSKKKKKSFVKKNLPCCPKCIPRKPKLLIVRQATPAAPLPVCFYDSDASSDYPDHHKYKT